MKSTLIKSFYFVIEETQRVIFQTIFTCRWFQMKKLLLRNILWISMHSFRRMMNPSMDKVRSFKDNKSLNAKRLEKRKVNQEKNLWKWMMVLFWKYTKCVQRVRVSANHSALNCITRRIWILKNLIRERMYCCWVNGLIKWSRKYINLVRITNSFLCSMGNLRGFLMER